ncbi:MAG TPA: DNA translocase FtsK [Pirellulaceae bacterium]|nr:DNA translocase FtsK [Pirellulaceae bacterium]HMP69351.1 DNA translocase FtsK [Pirellulaceae bacterium]
MPNQRNSRIDILAIVLLSATLFVGVSLLTYDRADYVGQLLPPFDRLYQSDRLVYPENERVQNACGYLGALTSDILFSSFGYAAVFFVAGMAAVAVSLIWKQQIQSLWPRTLGWGLALIGVATLLQLLIPDETVGPIIGSGGYVGALSKGLLATRFAFVGSLITAISVLIVGLILWTDYLLFKWISWAAAPVWTAIVYLFPTELFASRKRSKTSGSSTSQAAKRSRKMDDLSVGTATTMVTSSTSDRVDAGHGMDSTATDQAKEILVDKHGLRIFDEEVEFVDVGDQREIKAELEDPSIGNPIADDEFDVPPSQSLPLVLKTAAKSSLFPKLLRSKKQPTETAVEPKTTAVDSTSRLAGGAGTRLHGPHFKLKSVDGPTTPAHESGEREQFIETLNRVAEYDDGHDFNLPSINLLTPADQYSVDEKRKEAVRKGQLLEKAFKEFNLNVRVVDFETGPVITMYELELDSGLRLSKIMGLSNDLAIALRVPSVRIVAPIPNKNTVGVEVPNDTRQTVRLREVMEISHDKTRKMKIPLFLGKDVAGNPLVADLASLPHLLIAGRTGTGKSVCLNAIISSILMTRRPDEVRMLMIDPKMVELSGYGRLPHLMHPVVTDMRKAEAILAWAVDKMEERYALLARAGVRHITSYNQLSEEEIFDRLQPQDDDERDLIPLNLPFIVIVADEMADLMMTAGKEVEQHIIRLAQKSRAVGIHLILATQKPTVDVITGLIKSNLPARISFQVASLSDSRVVLDDKGAEKLLGNGDMLFLWPGTSIVMRGQGTFLSDDEIQSITDAVSTNEQHFVNELINLKVNNDQNESGGDGRSIAARDPLYHDAVETVIKGKRGSISLIQKNLGIGYGRAARLIDYMEEDGIVGAYNGSKSREVLVDLNQWESMKDASGGPRNVDVQTNVMNNSQDRYSAQIVGATEFRKAPAKPDEDSSRQSRSGSLRRNALSAYQEEDADDQEDIDNPGIDSRGTLPTFKVKADQPTRNSFNQVPFDVDESDDSSKFLTSRKSEQSLADGESDFDDDVDDDDESVEYEYEYVDEDAIEDGEEYEIEYHYIDEDDESLSEGDESDDDEDQR